MKRTLASVMSFIFVLGIAATGVSYADANEVSALKGQVSDLNKKIAALERAVGRMSSGGSSSSTYAVRDEGAAQGIIKTAQDINMGGYVDVQYNYNTDSPHTDSVSNPTSIYRVYDGNDGSFTVNAAKLYFEKTAEEVGEAGFRIDLLFGEDAVITNADGDNNKVDLQAAYIEYIAGLPFFEDSDILPSEIHIQAGRFATLAGFEVIEGPDNWNISRSVAYGMTIPFNHTGIRTNFEMFNEFLDVYLGLNNGWDLAVDNNGGKTLELGIGWSPIENVELFHTFYWGGEKDGTTAGRRWLNTNTLTWEITDALTYALEINYGNESDISSAARRAATPNVLLSAHDTTDSTWYSFNNYINYQFNDKFSMTARYELFRDPTLFRNGGTGTDTLFGQTYTAQYILADNLITRLEFRHDKSDDDNIFGNDTSRTTLGAQAIYLI